MMLATVLERYHCTLTEVREDYWLARAWRALAGDPELEGRVARVGPGHVLITGPGFTPASASARERTRWAASVDARVAVDTGRTTDNLGMSVCFAEVPMEVAQGCVRSLLAQTVAGDPRWLDLAPYAEDLAPVLVSVAHLAETIVAA